MGPRELRHRERAHSSFAEEMIEGSHPRLPPELRAGEDQVELRERELGQQLVGLVFATDDLNRWAHAKRRRQETSKDELRKDVAHADPELGGSPGHVAREGILQLPTEAEDLVGVPEDDPPRIRQREASPFPRLSRCLDSILSRGDRAPASLEFEHARGDAVMGCASIFENAEAISILREFDGQTLHFSGEAQDIRPSGQLCFRIRASGPALAPYLLPSYVFCEQLDGIVLR